MEETPAELRENLEAAGMIVREQMDEFFKWLDGKDLILEFRNKRRMQ